MVEVLNYMYQRPKNEI